MLGLLHRQPEGIKDTKRICQDQANWTRKLYQ